jgi:hypothetical protein
VFKRRTVHVTIKRSEDPSSGEVQAELRDISRCGVKLMAPSSPAIDENVVIWLRQPSIDLSLRLEGKVCWVRHSGRDMCQVGCVLSNELPEEVLTKLAVNGYVQRRQHARHAVDIPGSVRWELSCANLPVRVTDFSNGGFCMVCAEQARVGDRLVLELPSEQDQPSPILAKANWTSKTSEGYKVGCEFLSNEAPGRMRRCVGAADLPHQGFIRQWSWPVAVAAGLAVAASLLLTLAFY